MKICVIGLWHLGLVTSASLAKLGHKVIAVDEKDVINKLNKFEIPIKEKGLLFNLKKYKKNLKFKFDNSVFKETNFFWITYDTTLNNKDQVDINYLIYQIKNILKKVKKNSTILISSQIPIGTIKKIEKFEKSKLKKNIDFFYIPENLRLGNSLKNFLHPDRIVIGTNSHNKAKIDLVKKMFKKFKCKFYFVNSDTAEMTKHTINTFLACSISFINEISEISNKFDVNLDDLTNTIKSDKRIGFESYLRSGFSFSGGTLARDVNVLNEISRKYRLESKLISNILKSNKVKQNNLINLLNSFYNKNNKKKILQIGLTYKEGTDTLRRSFPYYIYQKFKKKYLIHVIDDDLKKNKLKKINFFQNKKIKFDIFLIFKKKKSIYSTIKKYRHKNSKVIDIGRLYYKLNKTNGYFS